MASLFNDLKGCYDRIRPSLNTIATRRMGCPTGAAVCHGRAVRQKAHQVQTSSGILEVPITWNPLVNPGGIGQGNGTGPQSYHGTLLVKLEAYEKLDPDKGLLLWSPSKELEVFSG